MEGVRRAPVSLIGRTLLVAAPALVLPFLIRSTVAGGVATATEVSTIAVIYALFVGIVLYGGIGWRKFYGMLVETAALTGSILLILGTALAMAWAITQAGVAQSLATLMTGLPGGWLTLHGRDDRRLPDPGQRARGPARHRAAWPRSCSRSRRASASTTSTTRW